MLRWEQNTSAKIILPCAYTYTGTWLITCWIEKPGLKMPLHFFQKAPSVDSMFIFPANGSMAMFKDGCLFSPDSETCRATSLEES
jgi:hypothetical protein